MFSDVPVPKRMRALQRDPRGYPIPFVVLRNLDNKPHFTINNDRRVSRCIAEKRCPVCGSRLDSVFWFVGGPLSAFHPNGAYLDPPMHYECMEYALRVCPYLAAPKYAGRIDAGNVDPARLAPEMRVMLDPTMIPERPSLFVAVATAGQRTGRRIEKGFGPKYLYPRRPYAAIEYWRYGVKLSDEEGKVLSDAQGGCERETWDTDLDCAR